MNRLIKIINEMSYEDLQKIRLDVEEGTLRELVDERLAYFEDENKVCPTCQNKPPADGFVLQFGPYDLRQQAQFCALDCLEYFLKQLKKASRKKEKREKIIAKSTRE